MPPRSKASSAWERRKNYSRQLGRQIRYDNAEPERNRGAQKSANTNQQNPLMKISDEIKDAQNVPETEETRSVPTVSKNLAKNGLRNKRKRSNSFTLSLDKTKDDFSRPDVDAPKNVKKPKLSSICRLAMPRKQQLDLHSDSVIQKQDGIHAPAAKKFVKPVEKPPVNFGLKKTNTFVEIPRMKTQLKQNNLETMSRRNTIQATGTNLKFGAVGHSKAAIKPLKTFPAEPKQSSKPQTRSTEPVKKYHVPAKIDTGLKNRKVNYIRPVTPHVKIMTKLRSSVMRTIDLDNPKPGVSGIASSKKSILKTPKSAQKRNSFTIEPQEDVIPLRQRRSKSFFIPNESNKKPITPVSILSKRRKTDNEAVTAQLASVSSSIDDVFLDCAENIPPVQTPKSAKRIPKRSKSVSFRAPPSSKTCVTLRKTPKPNQSLRAKLENWLDNHDSISNLRHVNCFGFELTDLKAGKRSRSRSSFRASLNASSLSFSLAENDPEIPNSESGASPLSQMNIINYEDSLNDYKLQLEQGVLPLNILPSLNEIERKYPEAKLLSLFWEVRAEVAKQLGTNKDAMAVICQALDFDVKPADRFKEVVLKYLQTSPSKQEKGSEAAVSAIKEETLELAEGNMTPNVKEQAAGMKEQGFSLKTLMSGSSKFENQVVKLALAKNSGSVKKLCQALNLDLDGFDTVLTPVRRSLRLATSEKKTFVEPNEILKHKRSRTLTVPNRNVL